MKVMEDNNWKLLKSNISKCWGTNSGWRKGKDIPLWTLSVAPTYWAGSATKWLLEIIRFLIISNQISRFILSTQPAGQLITYNWEKSCFVYLYGLVVFSESRYLQPGFLLLSKCKEGTWTIPAAGNNVVGVAWTSSHTTFLPGWGWTW